MNRCIFLKNIKLLKGLLSKAPFCIEYENKQMLSIGETIDP